MNTINRLQSTKKTCFFCRNGIGEIDYKQTGNLQRYTSSYGKIVPRRKSGACAWHQRKISAAIKRARIMALLPFINR
jgi:small subunit ribosomal protein S18